MNKYPYSVTGDHARRVSSRHSTVTRAEAAAAALDRKWGPTHPGAEVRVIAAGMILWSGGNGDGRDTKVR
jgi:hypothetical protein